VSALATTPPLCKAVRQQQLVVDRIEPVARARNGNELDRVCMGALVQQLEHGVLRIRARAAPADRGRRERQGRAVARDGLSVALHLELLEVGRQQAQPLVIGEDRAGGALQEAGLPDVSHGRENRRVDGERRPQEMLVHRARAVQQRFECVGAAAAASGSPTADHSE
jgi:hypothetical protein